MGVESKKDFKRLLTAVSKSNKKLKEARDFRKTAIREYMGKHYPGSTKSDPNPVNMIEQTVSIYTQLLASSNPQALITTHTKDLKPSADDLQDGINHLIKEINFQKTLEKCVIDAMFGAGIAKVGLETMCDHELRGFNRDAGQPFFDHVSLDDWVHDTTATEFQAVSFCGNKYRIPLEEAKKLDRFSEELRSKLEPVNKDSKSNRERVSGMSRKPDEDEYTEMTELMDLWLPREKKFITIAFDNPKIKEPLFVMDWDGPETGPYKFLSFSLVPDHIMPLSPLANLIDMHKLVNGCFNKLARQAERQKTILGYRSGEDPERIKKAQDGDAVRIDDPGSAGEIKFGGIDQMNLGFFLQSKQLYNYLAGNLDALGGLGAQSDTATQDELLFENASRRLSKMQDKVINFVRESVSDLAYYLFYDPFIEIPLFKRISGTETNIEYTLTPDRLEGDFLDYNFQISPHSLRTKTPEQKAQELMNIFMNVIVPLAPEMRQQGMKISVAEVIDILRKYKDLPELSRIIEYQTESEIKRGIGAGGQQPAQSVKPPQTTRKYVRENKPQGTQAGQDKVISQLMFGGNPQEEELKRAMG